MDRMSNDKLVVRLFENYSAREHSIELTDEDGANSYNVNSKTVEALHKRGILNMRSIYSTVQPDTETFEFTLKPKFKK